MGGWAGACGLHWHAGTALAEQWLPASLSKPAGAPARHLSPLPPTPLRCTPPPCVPPQSLFPSSFTRLVRVFDHKAVDLLLVKHEAASSQRERSVTAVAQAHAAAKAAAGGGGGGGSRAEGRAAARLAKAEAALAKWRARTEELERAIVEEQQRALGRPLGTAFIALFRWGWRAGEGGLGTCQCRCRDRGGAVAVGGTGAAVRPSLPVLPLSTAIVATHPRRPQDAGGGGAADAG